PADHERAWIEEIDDRRHGLADPSAALPDPSAGIRVALLRECHEVSYVRNGGAVGHRLLDQGPPAGHRLEAPHLTATAGTSRGGGALAVSELARAAPGSPDQVTGAEGSAAETGGRLEH